MTDNSIFESAKGPQEKQIGGSHYRRFHIQPYEFISKNEVTTIMSSTPEPRITNGTKKQI